MSDSTRLLDCYDRPALLSVLPLLYVAWADGDLGPDELQSIHKRLSRLSFLDSECRRAIEVWLDPESPPSPPELHRLLRAIHDRASSLPTPHRLSLVDLGLKLALADEPGLAPDPTEVQALRALATELGLAGNDIVKRLLPPEPEPDIGRREPAQPDWLPQLQDVLQHPFPAIRARVLDLLSSWSSPPSDVDRSAYRSWVTERTAELGRRGLGALAFPAELGGADTPGAFLAAFETLSLGDLSVVVKFGVQYGLFAGAIHQLGNDDHRRRYLAAASTMELPGCFAMTETGHGSNVQGLETTATYDPDSDEFVIHTPSEAARKDYIGNAARDAHMAVVFARLLVSGEDYGVHALLARIRNDDGQPAPGVRIEDCGDKLGLDGIDNGRIWFERVRVPRDHLLDRFGGVNHDGVYESPIPSDSKRFFTTLGALVGGRVSVALAALTVAKTAVSVAIGYGNRRRQFGTGREGETLILDYPSHQQRLMPLLATTYGLHFALRRLAEDYESVDEESQRRLETDAAGMKAYATWHATETVQICRECCGGQGYLVINRLADLKADSDVFTTFEGDNTVLMQLVAKAMLTGYRKQFADLNVVGIARFLAARAAAKLAELNPVVVRRTDSEHLRDPEFHAAALRYREEHLLTTATSRLKRRIDDGESADASFLACQRHLISAAAARVERHILRRFQAAVDENPDASCQEVLGQLAALLGVVILNRERAWFQEHGLMSTAKSRALQSLHEQLCAELRPHAQALVDAFGIPPSLLPEIAVGQEPATGA